MGRADDPQLLSNLDGVALPASGWSAPAGDDRAPALGIDERVRLMRDGLINYSSLLVSGICGIVLVPMLLRGLGAELYGLWIFSLAVAGVIGSVDLGLSASVTREVSGAATPEMRAAAARFIQTVGNAYAVLGLAGFALVSAVGLPISQGLHLSAESWKSARVVFFLVGMGLVGSQLSLFARAVLNGLRRFDLANAVSIGSVLLGTIGTIAILQSGASLVAVAAWQALVSLLTAAAAFFTIARVEPDYRPRLGRFRWDSLRSHVSFSLASQLATGAMSLVWQIPSFLIGLVSGPTPLASYYIAQKFPLAASQVGWCAAEALFPAASRQARAENPAGARAIFELGTRWVVILMLPICVVLWIVAPDLLRAWLGGASGEVVQVWRLSAAAVLVEAIGLGALYTLWGRGAAGTVLAVFLLIGGVRVGLALWLLTRIGIVGMAWAMLFSMAAGCAAFLHAASRAYGAGSSQLLRGTVKSLALPALACAASALAAGEVVGIGRWPSVLAASLAGGLSYAAVLYFFGAREEERRFTEQVTRLPAAISTSGYRVLRRILRRVRFLRSGWHLLHALMAVVRNPWNRARFDREFRECSDPWGYNTAWGIEHLQVTEQMLDAARPGAGFAQAMEIGCSVGVVTELLASRCASVLAVDFSPVALDVARQRFRGRNHVRFAQWDLCRDPAPGSFDLVLAMAVLECLYWPPRIRAARARIVELMTPGGYLLVSTTKQNDVVETAWWGRWLIQGSHHVNSFLAEDHRLTVCATATTDTHLFTLYRRSRSQE